MNPRDPPAPSPTTRAQGSRVGTEGMCTWTRPSDNTFRLSVTIAGAMEYPLSRFFSVPANHSSTPLDIFFFPFLSSAHTLPLNTQQAGRTFRQGYGTKPNFLSSLKCSLIAAAIEGVRGLRNSIEPAKLVTHSFKTHDSPRF